MLVIHQKSIQTTSIREHKKCKNLHKMYNGSRSQGIERTILLGQEQYIKLCMLDQNTT